MESKLHLEILKNLEQLFETKENYDVIIYAGEEPNQKEIHAHSIILCCQSNYFRAAFSNNWAEKENGKYIFKKSNILPYTFELFSDISIVEFLINNQKKILNDDPVGILEITFQHESFVTLKDSCLETICQHPDILFRDDEVLNLSADLLELLLQRDDLMMNEIELWKSLIRWAHAQHPTINKDPSEWTREECVLMEVAMSRFIPLIRFHDIDSKEYFDRIIPYEDLLSKKLRHEILRYHLFSQTIQIGSLPSRKCNINIINRKHFTLLTSWIDKKVVIIGTIPYKFKLILRGSRDGFSATSFHAKCDNKGATVVVAKIKNTNQIVGGYNPLDWEGNKTYNTTDSFIFSFDDYKNIDTGKLGTVTNAKYSIQCNGDWGPLFGYFSNGSNDLSMNGEGKWSSVSNSYSNINIPRNFEVDEYEVFQVVKD
ncbi:BTB/POZ domain-containing protein [Rhizophagus clarus]|uniref:BTB/POZ domain-containing protein n=1 Tax=Rhizophagus clarus TaxID=94130 RepID=A0A8H3L6Y1_9GLOM|nr:BTB/POZ domain-containing protein [Rhizophagus clarus]